MYIALEGVDGSGKTTQVERLAKYFEKQGRRVVVTSEPTTNLIIGKFIHEEILKAKVNIASIAFQFLYSADRVLNHTKIVEPALKAGTIVITHRCSWSTIAYGVVDQGKNQYAPEVVNPILTSQGIFSRYHQFIFPNKSFYLDVSVDTALKRLSDRGKDADIYDKQEKLEKVLNDYHWMTRQFKREIQVLDGEKSEEEITKEIIENL